MASKSRSDQYTIYVEYCRSCDTHSWCTHHDESKYHDTFLKCKYILTQSQKWWLSVSHITRL